MYIIYIISNYYLKFLPVYKDYIIFMALELLHLIKMLYILYKYIINKYKFKSKRNKIISRKASSDRYKIFFFLYIDYIL